MYFIRLDGVLSAPTLSELYDAKKLLAEVTDPTLAAQRYPTYAGGLILDFDVPTYVNGSLTELVPSRYYVRSRRVAVPIDSSYTGKSAGFGIELEVYRPWRYSQSTKSMTGNGTARNMGDATLFPTLTITLAGAGHAAYTATNSTTSEALVLDLSGAGAGTIVVEVLDKTILDDGVDAPGLYSSGAFPTLAEGANTIAYTNTTNATSVLSWREAWSV
jgi:hypothetical protein